MIEIQSIADIELLRESVDLECKLAGGRDGQGAVPEDFWLTYSAFANAQGGMVLLGLRDKNGQFETVGIQNVAKVRKELFDGLNNRQKVSVNLLTDASVREIALEGKTILAIDVPRATRKQRPVYLTTNPLAGHTYRRLNDGDRALPDEGVKRMLAEQVEDSRDTRILAGFGLEDVDLDSLHAFRNMLASHKPDHPWIVPDDDAFLRLIGGWRQDRNSGEQGLTLAGLLMFGQWPAIQDGVPYYFVDYQEQPEDKESDTRWLDRVVPDGTWSGNLFDFFRKVTRKLAADLKVPFALKDGVRQDDTPLHRALREALINALVHADYSDRASVLVIKRPSGFVFRNPGVLRVPAAQALQGGESDCRNRTLHQMFLMIGFGERAGSGLPKIRQGWEGDGGTLKLFDSYEPYDQTRLEMNWGLPASSGKTLGKTLGKTPGKTPERILELLRQAPHLSIPEVATRLEKSESAIERAIRKLRSTGQLVRVGPDKGGYWKVMEQAP